MLVPSSPSIPILINRNEGEWSGYWDHPVKWIEDTGTQLLFVDFFDWDDRSFRDFQYCLVRVEKFEQHPELTGRYALVEPRYVRAYFNLVP